MVVGAGDHGLQADIIFVIEGTAINGAYLNDLKSNYVVPTLEYFSQGTIEERDYVAESTSTQYGLVIYQAADCLPNPSSDCYGPYSSPQKLLNILDKIELVGGKGESHANIAEGLATALQCFEDLQQRREPNLLPQKHCILLCNSPPYLLPVMESPTFAGHTVEQLAVLLQERGIHLSILSPRKIPALFKLYEKAGGDLQTSQTKNYAKDPRHLVLLKGYSLKERPISPIPGPIGHPTPNISSMPSSSPNQSNGSPMGALAPCPGGATGMPQQQAPMMNSQGVQPAVFRPTQTQGLVMPPQQQHPPQGVMHPNPRNTILFPQQPQQSYSSQGILVQNRPPRWPLPMMQPQQQSRQFPNQSALIAQLTQPTMGTAVNPTALAVTGQFNQNNPTPVMGQQQQMHNMSRVPQQPGQGGSMNLPPMVGPGPGQQPGPGQSAPPPPQPNQSGNSSGQQPQTMGPQQTVTAPQQGTPPGGPGQPSAQQQPGQQNTGQNQQRQTLWQGVLEWIEKAKNPNDTQKVTRHVPCQVSANPRDGEPDLKADSWPQKLIMQLMPKQLIGNIGGAYLKNSKSVLFHPQNCEALESLTKVMSSGFAGCVHFTSVPSPQTCDIKVLILLYTSEKRAYLGFIPNDQAAFVDRLRKVIQHQKTTQALIRQQGGQANAGALPAPSAGVSMNPQQQQQQQQQQLSASMGGPGGGPQPGQQQTNPQQGPQGGIMMSQTNPMTMGGGQITQNVVTSAAQQMQQQVVSLGQQGAGGPGAANSQASPAQLSGLQNAERHLGGPGGNQQQPGAGGPIRGGQGMMAGAPQRPPFDNIEAARQQNLAKIQHLRQTLEAAQQQELQYKSQLEIISHIKIQQLQQNLEMAQQQEIQFKAQMEQEQQKQLRVQLQQLTQQQQQQRQMAPQGMQPSQPQQQQQPNQQQRMVRPGMPNNPGLRHLLQQQPQYRQVLNMQQLGSLRGQQQNPGGQPQPQQYDDVPPFDFLN